MAKVRGLDHFTQFFRGLEEHYVIVGGSAASVLMEDNALTFRPTVDIDVVILAYPADEFSQRMSQYIKAGGYENKEATEGPPKYYRFTKPKSEEYPKMIEIFAKNSLGLELDEGQYIVPVDTKGGERLSAILLDEEYFRLIQKNTFSSQEGHRIIKTTANICLKARAFRELSERKASGENVDAKDIKKHRNDVLKLAMVLTDQDHLILTGQPKKDLDEVLQALGQIDGSQFKQIMADYPNRLSLAELLAAIKKAFST